MKITDAIAWLDQHPTSAGILLVVVLWLFISLLSLLENPRPGSTLALVVDGVKKWGVDLPGTARWLKSILSHVRDARTSQLLAQAGMSAPPAAPSLAEVPPAVSSTAPTPIPGDLPPVLQFPVKPPPPDPPGAA